MFQNNLNRVLWSISLDVFTSLMIKSRLQMLLQNVKNVVIFTFLVFNLIIFLNLLWEKNVINKVTLKTTQFK